MDKIIRIGILLIIIAGCNRIKNVSKETDSKFIADTPPTPSSWRIEKQGDTEYLIDWEGNSAELQVYNRIVILSPGAVETLYLIGGEGAIAGIAESRDAIYPEEKTRLLPTVGNAARPNLESIIALEPDLVIGNAMNSAFIGDIKQRGYRGILHGAVSMSDIFDSTILLGKLTGQEETARQLTAEKTAVMDTLKNNLRNNPIKLKGAFLYSAGPLMAFTSASLAGEILDILGVDNIAAGLEAAQPILSSEYILAQDPDFLFGAMSISKPEDIFAADSVIAQTRAGREGNISIVPSSLFLRPSPRLVDAILILHNELEEYRKGNSGKTQSVE